MTLWAHQLRAGGPTDFISAERGFTVEEEAVVASGIAVEPDQVLTRQDALRALRRLRQNVHLESKIDRPASVLPWVHSLRERTR